MVMKRHGRTIPHRILALSTVVAMIAALGGAQLIAPPSALASSPDQATTDVEGGLSHWASFLDGTATNGLFGQQLPGLNLVPAGPDGIRLSDAFATVLSGPLGGDFGGATTLDQLAGELDAVSDTPLGDGTGRTVSITAQHSTSGGIDRLPISITINRNVQVGLAINATSQPFSFSSTAGVNARATLTTRIDVGYDRTSRFFWIEHTATTPSMSLDVTSTSFHPTSAKGAIGILGVQLSSGSTFSYGAHLVAAFADPNNDGKLAFTEPGVGDGELAGSAAPTGLVSVVWAPAPGSLTGSLTLQASPSNVIQSLPSATATVAVSAPDLSATNPVSASYPTGALDPLQAFERLTPKDLADALGQLEQALNSVQTAHLNGGLSDNVDLPFMKGTLADVVQVSEALHAFLAHYVEPIPVSNGSATTTVGKPLFSSIQELLDALQNPAAGVALPPGTSFTVPSDSAIYVPTAGSENLSFTLGITRTRSGPQPADPVAATLTGTADYSTTSVTHTSSPVASSMIGRTISVDGYSAAILAVPDSHTLTLDPAPLTDPSGASPPPTTDWQGATAGHPSPTNGHTYSIAAGDPGTGEIQLGDVLAAKSGVTAVNASVPVATVDPSYQVTLPVVLDLSPPTTTQPSSITNPDGTTTVVAQRPTAAERVALRVGPNQQPLFTLDAPISTDVSADASVGFIGVHVTGSLIECTAGTYVAAPPAHCSTPGSGDPHLLTLSLLNPEDSKANGALSLPELFADLSSAGSKTGTPNPGQVISAHVKGEAHAQLTLTVPKSDGLLPGGQANVHLDMADMTSPSAVSVAGDDLTPLLDFNFDPANPKALFGALLQALSALDSTTSGLGGSGALHDAMTTQVPLLGSTVQQLLSGSGGQTALTQAVSDLQASPADGLQPMIDRLEASLGQNSTMSFGLDTSTSPPTLTITLDWHRGYSASVPLALKVGTYDLTGGSASGVLQVQATGEVLAHLRMPLSTDAMSSPLDHLQIDPSSQVTLQVSMNAGTDKSIRANIGPLAVSVGDPSGQNSHLDAHLKLGVGLTDSTDTTPVSLTSFASELSAGLNQGVPAVTCDSAPTVDSTNLAFCAVLPIYTSSDGSTWNLIGTDVPSSSILVRIPQLTAGDLADQLDPTGTVGSGSTPRVQLPADLLSKIESSYLDLSSLDDGLLGYLKFVKQSMALASNHGKLPLVGSDLQQGSDFVGKVQTAIDGVLGGSALTNGKLPTAADYQTTLDNLKTSLSDAKVVKDPSSYSSSLTCTVNLSAVGAPTVTPTPTPPASPAPGTTVQYEYKVVAYHGSGNSTVDSPLSDPSQAIVNVPASQFDATHYYNTVTWTPVDYADGYLILRADDSASPGTFGPFTQVGTQSTPPTSGTDWAFDDHAASGSSYSVSPSSQVVAPCTPDTPGSDVSGVVFAIDLGSGDPTKLSTSCPAGAYQVPLHMGVPGLSFSAASSSGPGTGLCAWVAWSLHLSFHLDRSQGFYVDTQADNGPGHTSVPELQVGVGLDLPSTLKAQLAFLKVNITKHPGVTAPLFSGLFSIDLHSPSGPTCNDPAHPCAADTSQHMTLGQLTTISSLSDVVTPLLSATANIDWDIVASTDSGAALPGIGAEFVLQWTWDSKTPGSTLPTVLGFKNVTIDPGQFLGKVLGPVASQIADAVKPIKPITDTIQAPLPVLSDLSKAVGGSDVTLASLATTFSTIEHGPDIGSFLTVVKKAVNLTKALSSGGSCAGGARFCVNVGSFTLDPAVATTQPNTPDLVTTTQLIKSTDTGTGPDPLTQLNGDMSDSTASLTDTGAADGSQGKHPGFEFPALQDPTQLFQLLMGHDVTLATFDSGTLALGFTFSEEFGPVYAPPPVNVVISGSAGVSVRIKAGFDTYGIRKAVEAGKTDAGVLDSLYLATTDSHGKPLPVVSFTGTVAAGAEVTAFVLKAGVKGGVTLTVNFYWHDPDNDGKFRFNEFLSTAFNNPICLFNVGGQLSLFLKVFITIGVDPFSVSFNFSLVNIRLLDFSLTPNCNPDPPRLGGVSGGALYLYAGKFGTGSIRGDSAWSSNNTADEKWIIREDSSGHVTVAALGVTHTFTQSITAVVFDGRGYDGNLQVMFQGASSGQPFDLKTVVFGGKGNDVISTGEGASYVDGGPGNDQITTHDRPDPLKDPPGSPSAVIAGGPGDDVITTGNAQDWVAGDGSLSYSTISPKVALYDPTKPDTSDNDLPSGNPAPPTHQTLSNVVDPGNVGHPSAPSEATTDGDDLITVGIGGSTIWGGGGADKIGTSQSTSLSTLHPDNTYLIPQPNTIIGGSGGDMISSGSASDVIYAGSQQQIGPNDTGPADGTNIIDTGSGNDIVYGAAGTDLITVHSLPASGTDPAQHATVYGGGGNDIIDGGDGTDLLYGGPGNDTLIAQPATVDTKASISDALTPITHTKAYRITLLPDSNAQLSKTLVGGGGSDRIYGGDGPSTIYGDQQANTCTSPGPADSDPPAETGVTATDAADLIIGGNGADQIQAGGGNDVVYANGGDDVICGSQGADQIDAGPGNDTVFGGTGNDTVFGGPGDDHLYGNAQDDHVYGGTGNNVIEGNAGSDTLVGGPSADLIVGGTRYAGRPDSNDYIYGAGGDDLLIGDNGVPVGGPDATGAGTPYDLAGNVSTLGGADWIFGGDGNDHVYGGLGDDHLYGGAGNDVMLGNDGSDHLYGQDGSDDLIGGSSQTNGAVGLDSSGMPDGNDVIDGGAGSDVITGDNAVITDLATGLVGVGSPPAQNRGLPFERSVTLLDLGQNPASGTSGDDTLYGSSGNDVLYGQDGSDHVYGGDGNDYAEGGPGSDYVYGGAGDDDLVGGSSTPDSQTARQGQPDGNDRLDGGTGNDVVAGDNAQIADVVGNTGSVLTRGRGLAFERSITLLDLGYSPLATNYGNDVVLGGDGTDVLLGEGGDDYVNGGNGDDYAEGGPGSDYVYGGPGDDDLVGGSSTAVSGSGDATAGQLDSSDVVSGGAGDDVITGDNALVTRVGQFAASTFRVGSDPAGSLEPGRSIQLLDQNLTTDGYLKTPSNSLYGGDQLSGGSGNDVIYGQDGNDQISGGAGDDYVEGNGGADSIYGDTTLGEAGVTRLPAPTDLEHNDPTDASVPAVDATADPGDASKPNGQDDLIGGGSIPGFRDGNDTIYGDGGADFILGDNGAVVRDVVDSGGNPVTNRPTQGGLSDRVYISKYPTALPADAAYVRHGAITGDPSAFCATAQPTTAQPTCAPSGASGDDILHGGAGDDTMYGQDGNDIMSGGTGNDDMYGGLGADTMDGGAGNDAMLGDRGGIVDVYQDGSNSFTIDDSQVPQVHYDGLQAGTVLHEVDLLHAVAGDTFVGASTSTAMPYDGMTYGGNDMMRGGSGQDVMHGGAGDDLMNGDSGGDVVFGDDGADVLWGGKGCDQTIDNSTSSPDCYPGGTFDPNAHGAGDRMVDYLIGGKGGQPGDTSMDPTTGVLGSDIMDWRPRGTYDPGTGCTTTQWPATIKGVEVDPCTWFVMTSLDNNDSTDDQHHQGVDWMYGGWGRDIMQGDVTANGPNTGDLLIDWAGAYNLYSHCNAAYGGYNDIRQFSPDMETFLQQLAYSLGAGQGAPSDVITSGTSAFDELALIYHSDLNSQGSGSAFPSTPGHFNSNACAS